jgi:hypothetical protein
MNEFMDKLSKIRSGFFTRMRFLFLLDLISVFSIFYAIFIIFQVEYFLKNSSVLISIPISIIKIMSPILAFIIAIIGAFLVHRNDHKINLNLLIENKYPDLKEKLRTAYDNRNETNVIVESLKSLVLSGLTIVSASSLISTGVVVTKIILVTMFISGAAYTSLNQDKVAIPPDVIANNFKNITGIGQGAGNETIAVVGQPENIQNVGYKGGGEIFGKPKIASLEGKNIDLTLYSGMGTGFEVRDVSQTQNLFRSTVGDFPVNPQAANVSDGGYRILMGKTQSEKDLITNYSIKRDEEK